MDQIDVRMRVRRYGGRLVCDVKMTVDSGETSTYRFEGSARSIDALDEALSLVDGGALAWLIGLSHRPVVAGGDD